MLLLSNPKTDEKVCVTKPDKWDGDTESLGYPDWEVLDEFEGLPPDHATWIKGQGWVVDEDLAATQAEEARLNALSRTELLAEVTNKLETLRMAHVCSVEVASLKEELAKRDVQDRRDCGC
jgi:hypothetical protein